MGDSAETISLLWPVVMHGLYTVEADLPPITPERPLHWWMEILLPAISGLRDQEQSDAVIALWQAVPIKQHFIVNKLLTGGFRVGVSTGLISRSIAQAFALDDNLVVQRLMGGFEPSAQRFQQLSAPENAEERRSSGTPTPFSGQSTGPEPGSGHRCDRLARGVEMGWHPRAADPPGQRGVPLEPWGRAGERQLPGTGGCWKRPAERNGAGRGGDLLAAG